METVPAVTWPNFVDVWSFVHDLRTPRLRFVFGTHEALHLRIKSDDVIATEALVAEADPLLGQSEAILNRSRRVRRKFNDSRES